MMQCSWLTILTDISLTNIYFYSRKCGLRKGVNACKSSWEAQARKSSVSTKLREQLPCKLEDEY